MESLADDYLRFTHCLGGAKRALAAAGILSVSIPGVAQSADKAGYQPFPADPAYEYPTAWSTIHDWMEAGYWGKVRDHGWRLFIGANQPATAGSASGLRVFETWYTLPETFAAPATKALTAIAASTGHSNINAQRKFLNRTEISPNYVSTCGFAGKRFLNNGDLMVAGVYFSQEYFGHIQDNRYYSQNVLNNIWQGNATAIKNFPNKTFQVKHMYWPVPQKGYAALPVFPGFNPAPDPNDPARPVMLTDPAKYNGYETWNKAVAVTADSGTAGTADATYAWRDFQNVPTVNVRDFYYTQIDQAAYDALDSTDICILNQASNGVYGRDFAVGDYLVTIGMHVMVWEDADLTESGLLPAAANPVEVWNTWPMQTFWYEGAPAPRTSAAIPTSKWSFRRPSAPLPVALPATWRAPIRRQPA